MFVSLRGLVNHVAIHQRIMRAMMEQQWLHPDWLCRWTNGTCEIIGLDSI